jgi:superkiller protein 3
LQRRQGALQTALAEGASSAVLLEAWAELGRGYLAQGFDAAAEKSFAAAEALAPDDAEWPYLRAHALRRQSRGEDARAAFSRAVELEPENVPSLVWRGEMEALLDQAEAAEATVGQALALDPDNAMALFRAGQLAAESEDYARAAELLGRVLEVQPDADRVRHPYALALRELGRLDEAQAQLAQAGERKPGQPDQRLARVDAAATGVEVLVTRGGQAFERGDLREALELFDRAVRLAPDHAGAHVNFGAALISAGRPAVARRHLERAVELEPDNAMARFSLGTFFGSYEEDGPAIEHLSHAIAIDPELDAARFNLANALRRQGRCRDAVPHYARLLEKNPSNRAARFGHADCYVATNQWAEALAALQAAEQAAPDDARLLALHARLLSCCPADGIRNGTEAVRLAEQAVRLQPNAEQGRTLALAYHEAGDREKALEWARATLAAAERAGARKTATTMSQTVSQIENGYPCRTP